MRTVEEINADVHKATSINDAEALMRYAAELDAIGTPQAEAESSRARGWAFYLRGDYPSALEHYRHALALYEVLGDRSGVARVIGNIGNVHQTTCDYPAALEYHHRALALHEELGERRGVAIDMGNIGNAHRSTGDYGAALEHYHRALALHEELGNRSGVAIVTGNIGNVHISTGEYPAALEHYHRALALFEVLGNRSGVAGATSNIVETYLSMGSDMEALALLDTMDAMQIDSPEVRISREQHRATLQERSGDLDSATTILQRALSEAHDYHLRVYAADMHKTLRDLAQKRNDFTAYIEHNNEYTRITEEVNGKEATLKMAMQAKQREIDAKDREHEQHMAVLHSTLPKYIADRVARGETVNDHYDNAAVIFLDIVGFTDISSFLDSRVVIELLDGVFTKCDAICAKYDVVKIKTIGDSYMAVAFGTANVMPSEVEALRTANSAVRAAHAALEMMNITLSEELTTALNEALIKFRIGIHCGPVTAGVIGTQRMQYDVWGDTVNVASRMESTSEAGRIHVSEVFASALKEAINVESRNVVGSRLAMTLRERGTIEVKGKGSMQTYWLE